MLKALYQIPVCVSLVYVSVQCLRVALADLLGYGMNQCEDRAE